MFLSDLLNATKKRIVSPSRWHVLCLAFHSIDVRFKGSIGRFQYQMRHEEVRAAEWSLGHFPLLARECSCGLVEVAYDILHISRPLSSLTNMGGPKYWPSPDDVRPELLEHAPDYDSVFVFWPRNDLERGCTIPSGGWGLAIGPGNIPGGGTYCSVASAADADWNVPCVGEVWLHEWLHGVCDFYESKGFPMPASNADGGGSHGYARSPVTGWCRYYRDLMTGRVRENGRSLGITPEAWLGGTIRSK
ncbi:MAG TPA: hypothetical protein VMC84_13620 [Methanocella sp.]|nr:hypothetical protein [Methanocella sp.]